MRVLKVLAVMLALASAVAWAAPDRWQDLPDSLQLESMGDSLRMNGTPMLIRAFHSRQSAETLLHNVQSNWERDPGHGPVRRSRIPNWTVLNQAIGEQHRSFQVHEQDGLTRGFVAVSSPKETRAPVLTVRLPMQVQAMQVIDSVDADKVSQQVVAVSQRSVDATTAALGDALKAQAWDKPTVRKQGHSVRMSTNRGDEQFDALISGEKHGALILINTIR